MTSIEFIENHKVAKKDFTRKRSLPFQTVFLILINFLKKSIQAELDNFFKILLNKEIPLNEVTKGAFSIARGKLKSSAFVELNAYQIEYFYNNSNYKTWNGFRILGIDGSIIRLPSSEVIKEKYGTHDHSETGTLISFARISQAYDLLNSLTIDALISTYNDNEQNLALQHSRLFKSGDLAIFDRNYASFWMFSLLMQKQTHFCARLKINTWKAAKELLTSGKKEAIIEIHPSNASVKKCKELGLPINPIKLRLICVEIENNEKEVLITSLIDELRYPHEIFSELYQLRWQIEESYKTMKSRLEIENFTGKSCLSIEQDIYAKVFSCNLTVILLQGAEKIVKKISTKRGRNYKPNFTQALIRKKDSIVLLFCREKKIVDGYINELIGLFAKNIEIERIDRHFNRNFRKSKQIYPMPYKNTF